MAKDVVADATEPEQVLSIDTLKALPGIATTYVPDSYADLNAYFEAEFGGVIEFQGSPWDLIRDKKELVEVPFLIADVRFYEGKFGDACAILAVCEDDRKVVFNDGSTGIFAQAMQAVSRSGRRGGFNCPRGLRASTYEYQETDLVTGEPVGKPVPATTYYIG